MTIEQVCEYLELSRATILRRVKEGALTPLPKKPGLKIHRRLEFKREDVERFRQGA